MSRKERENPSQAAFMCPACKHPVASAVTRHKTLGIFVPVWGPGPCHNPDCRNFRADTERTEHHTHS